MNKSIVGVIFCLIAAFLYLGNYLVVALMIPYFNGFDENIMNTVQSMIGKNILYLAGLSLILGAVYLVFAEIEYIRQSVKKHS